MVKVKWTYESVRLEALKYSSRTEFSTKSGGAYSAAKRHKWLEDVCAHIPNKLIKYSDEYIFSVASKFETKSEFQRTEPKIYQAANERKLLAEIGKNMKRGGTKWTLEKLSAEAKKYETRGEFKKRNSPAYGSARKQGLLNTICKHMSRANNSRLRCIYVIYNKRLNLAYVGLTYKLEKRLTEHFSKHNRCLSKKITTEVDTEHLQLTPYMCAEKAAKKERETMDLYSQKLGYTLLNSRTAAGLLGSTPKWSKARIENEAKKYQSLSEFNKKSPSAYRAAQKLGILDKVCPHMEGRKLQMSLSLATSIAKEYSYRTEFKKNNSTAYNYLRKKGLLDSVCSHMPKPKRHTKESCFELAKKYSSRIKFKRENSGAYSYLTRLGLLEEALDHMESKIKTKWNERSANEEAKKYHSKNSFQVNSRSAYDFLYNRGLLEGACSHMTKNNG